MSTNFSFTLSDIKKQLGPGLGLKVNKYLIEMPMPGVQGKKLAILCQSTALPEHNIDSIDIYSKGRRFKIRGETNFQGTYTINIIDDSEMKIRSMFDAWLRLVDNTKPKQNGVLGMFGSQFNEALEAVSGVIQAANSLKSQIDFDGGMSFLTGAILGTPSAPSYQADINVWQLSKQNTKVYGYKLQNAWPTEVGAVELDDSNEAQLSQFSVTFAYSELEPIKPKSFTRGLIDTAIGDTGQDIVNGVENLFD